MFLVFCTKGKRERKRVVVSYPNKQRGRKRKEKKRMYRGERAKYPNRTAKEREKNEDKEAAKTIPHTTQLFQ
jgi:hypothetical protein